MDSIEAGNTMRIASLEKCIPSLDANIKIIDERTQVILEILKEVKGDALKTAQDSQSLSIKIAEAMMLLSSYERDKDRLEREDKQLMQEIEKVEDLAVKRTEDVIRIAAYEQDKDRLEVVHSEIKGDISKLLTMIQDTRITMAKSGLLMGGGGLIGLLLSLLVSRIFENLF